MPLLHLLRHAKAAAGDTRLDDHDRPLTPEGEHDAERVARHLDSAGMRPDIVLCSSALRARQTLEPLLRRSGVGLEVRFDDQLYVASAGEVIEILQRMGPAGAALVVGHNPTIGQLAVALAGSGDAAAVERLRAGYPAGTLSTLDLGQLTWAQLEPGRARLTAVAAPRDLPPLDQP